MVETFSTNDFIITYFCRTATGSGKFCENGAARRSRQATRRGANASEKSKQRNRAKGNGTRPGFPVVSLPASSPITRRRSPGNRVGVNETARPVVPAKRRAGKRTLSKSQNRETAQKKTRRPRFPVRLAPRKLADHAPNLSRKRSERRQNVRPTFPARDDAPGNARAPKRLPDPRFPLASFAACIRSPTKRPPVSPPQAKRPRARSASTLPPEASQTPPGVPGKTKKQLFELLFSLMQNQASISFF